MCGEKNLRRDFTDAAQGSPPRMRGKAIITMDGAAHEGITPPRMRGKVSGGSVPVRLNRITPAYAGKSFFEQNRRYIE